MLFSRTALEYENFNDIKLKNQDNGVPRLAQ